MKNVFFVLLLIVGFFYSKNLWALFIFNCGNGPCPYPNVCNGESNYIQDDYVPSELFLATYDSLTENLKCFCRNYGGNLAAVELIPGVEYSVAGVEFFCKT